MKVGIAAPVSLRLLSRYVDHGDKLPKGYEFPPLAILVEEYLRRGHQISLFTLDSTTRKPKAFRGEQLTIHIGRYRPRARYRSKDFFAAERGDLIAAMKGDPCEVIHAHWTYEFALAATASGYPHVVTAHDAPLHVVRLYPGLYRSLRFLMALKVARSAQHLTAVSPYVAEHFRRVLRYRRPIKVISNGLPSSLFVMGDGGSRASCNSATFATVLNGWSRLKNGQVALQAFSQVRRAVPEARLLMFGVGHGLGEEGAGWALRKGLSEGVEFVGATQHPTLMERLASEVDIFVHPSLEEAHPLSVSEAMALGIPVIGGAYSGGVPHTLESGKAGLLVDVRSPQALAGAMFRLVEDREKRLALGRAARRSAWDRFRLEHVVDAYEETYDEAQGSFRKGNR